MISLQHIKELNLNSLSKQIFETCVQFNVILVKVAVKFFGPEDFSNTNKLWAGKKKQTQFGLYLLVIFIKSYFIL